MEERPLPLKHQSFVAEYVVNGGIGTAAAVAAGYAPNSAKHTAYKLLRRPEIKAAVDEARQRIKDAGMYDVDRAMAELYEVIRFARETKNATAMARAVELRARIAGVLTDNINLRTTTVDISGALIEARKRAGLPGDLVAEYACITDCTAPEVDPFS